MIKRFHIDIPDIEQYKELFGTDIDWNKEETELEERQSINGTILPKKRVLL